MSCPDKKSWDAKIWFYFWNRKDLNARCSLILTGWYTEANVTIFGTGFIFLFFGNDPLGLFSTISLRCMNICSPIFSTS